MRGVYEAQVQISSLAAAKTLMYLTAPAAKCVEFLSASVTAVGSNVTNQNIECCLQRIGTLGTPTGTSLTPSKEEAGDQAAGSTVVGNVTGSEPTYTSNTQVNKEGAASLAGWRYQPVPEERMMAGPSESVGLRLLDTSITTGTFNVVLRFREIG